MKLNTNRFESYWRQIGILGIYFCIVMSKVYSETSKKDLIYSLGFTSLSNAKLNPFFCLIIPILQQ
ncbi:hypothetical protein LEP1GSC151_5347 [Leptospira interrogans serovar Grippotyphosa str. LT2186]|uniref:Uncharacterized protein n=4 Tax=Leptospira interrogans TaxID=173 RepID=M3GN41_LEPIR|nr:hypothetical protein G436_3606 [Leptospira interrogans serovar Hardjo str. Norma]EJP05902.1 hypothetical protein LEP1GSC007_3451 [Leptospira interrogans serovar Bulgarica str. Mallika]EKO69375.1 hypothetical protein LEP1GSC069_3107 [Leptospira interrogans serovar Canicola str. Fiocruz LV133]EMF42546.1 hypothetical protein LEP1GSC067_4923 [Leptospira interrogans serovar Lora str. TE 1992]EMG08023.1 hypothetical protein LEP1GSC151_5347 [Leptospira interrogans serovar Grippotyphosa str. LT2186]